MESEDLSVIGHIGDLLVDICASNATHIYILPWCSVPAARLFNPTGIGTHFERSRCAISGGILISINSCIFVSIMNKSGIKRKTHNARKLYYGFSAK